MCRTMANICRLCGKEEHHAIFIFGNVALKHYIDLKIRVGLDIQIFPNDPLPKYACVCCLGKLDEFWTFQTDCRRVQTNLRRLLPERVPFKFQNINCDQHQNSKVSTEESSAHIEVLQTLGNSTDNDINNPGDFNLNNNGKVEVDKVKVTTHSHENSNDSFHFYNESCGNECEPYGNDSYLIHTDLLVTTQNGTSVAAGRLDSYCQDKEENMAITAAVNTSGSALEGNPVTVEGESEVQDNLVSEEADATNTILRHCGTPPSVNNNVNSPLFSDRSQDSVLMERQTLGVLNTVLSSTSILTPAEKAIEDNRCKDILSVNNDLNTNPLEAPNIILQSSHNKTSTTKKHHDTKSTDTCSYLNNMSQSSLLMKEQASKNRNNLTDDVQDMSKEVVNNVTNNKDDAHRSIINRLRDLLLKKKRACKTSSPATDTCSQSITVHEVQNGEVTPADSLDSSQLSVIITDLSLNHPNHIGSSTTNVSSCIETSHKESSSADNSLHTLRKVRKSIPDITGKVAQNTRFCLNVVSNIGDSQPLQVMHSDAETTLTQERNIDNSGKVSDLKASAALTSEDEPYRTLQQNPAMRKDSNTNHESKGHSMNVDSENSTTCAHGIDARMCVYEQCCDSHPFDLYWKKVGSHFRCLLCEFVTVHVDKIRCHISAHASFNVFECSICYKKLRTYKNLTLHMKLHSRKVDKSSRKVFGVYPCENCFETFNGKANLRRHQIKYCKIGSSSCPDCGLRLSSLKRHTFSCPGKTGFICDICKKSYKLKTVLIKHLRAHEQGEFPCNKCEKIYSSSYLLRNHQNAEHGTGKFKCTYCTKSFFNKQRLETHVVSHTGIRNYLCEICSKSFLNGSNLVTHMKFHGKKDIKCHLCGKMYFRKNMLLSHMKNVHCK